jgi:hypothetical protein
MGQNGGLVPSSSHAHADGYSQLGISGSDTTLDRERLVKALQELHRLLEDYAPSWYTRKYHDRAEAALHSIDKR